MVFVDFVIVSLAPIPAVTVAILAQGTHWAVAVTQAFFPFVVFHLAFERFPAHARVARHESRAACHEGNGKADSTLRSSQAVPHPSTNRALCRLTSEVERDPVHSTRYGRQRKGAREKHLGGARRGQPARKGKKVELCTLHSNRGHCIAFWPSIPTTEGSAQFCLLCCQPEPVPGSSTARMSWLTPGDPCRLPP